MRILHVTRSYLPLSQTFVINTLVLLKRLGGENFLLTVTEDRPIHSSIARSFSLFRYPEFFGLKRWWIIQRVVARMEPFFLIINHKKILNFVNELKVEGIHYHFGWAYEAFSKSLGLDSRPMIISFHGSDVSLHPKRSPKYKKAISTLALRGNVIFTTPSCYLKNELLKWGIAEEKIEVLYNTYDAKLFSSSKQSNHTDKKFLKVINVSRMVSWKGQRYLIEAFAEYLKHHKGQLTLVGGGEELPKMKELAEKLGIFSSVRFMDELSHDRVQVLLKEHDVYVQPSTFDTATDQCETFGIVLLEAIASGLVVVATRTGGMPEVVSNKIYENQFYFLVNDKQSSEIADVFKTLSSEKYQFTSNSEYAQERLSYFSNESYMAKLKEIYQNLLKRNF